MSQDGLFYEQAVALLKELIATPSFSRQEDQTAGILCRYLGEKGIVHVRTDNNVFAANRDFDPKKATILLNSHHDTVKPNGGYTNDPFKPIQRDGKLFGLGSNDAGGALVSLWATFCHYYSIPDLRYNLVFAATAEEEISGPNGIEKLLTEPAWLDLLRDSTIYGGIVGEPTLLQLATAERGLMVIDAEAKGRSGHAARNEGDNAIYRALRDIEAIRRMEFDKISPLLGPSRVTVTVIETENKAHNVVPDSCKFVIDARVNELYSFEEVIERLRSVCESDIHPRSTRLKSTSIPWEHPLVQSGIALGKECYGSPTTSDKALMPFPTLKAGPGDSARSHTADEFIYLDEIRQGISFYIDLLKPMLI